uniref:Zinc finger protein n=1 Tax=Streptomyces citricolor TaxID=212427 RepID=A0A7R6JX09_9ACTN|nr:zinc finger protein [Streptomyces citricolor]
MARVGKAGTEDKAARTTAQIEADIERTRKQLAVNLDELAMRVHPSTVAAQTKAKMRASVEQKAGRAYVAVSGAVEQVKAHFTDEQGRPRQDRIVPAALVGTGVLLLIASARSKRKRG